MPADALGFLHEGEHALAAHEDRIDVDAGSGVERERTCPARSDQLEGLSARRTMRPSGVLSISIARCSLATVSRSRTRRRR